MHRRVASRSLKATGWPEDIDRHTDTQVDRYSYQTLGDIRWSLTLVPVLRSPGPTKVTHVANSSGMERMNYQSLFQVPRSGSPRAHLRLLASHQQPSSSSSIDTYAHARAQFTIHTPLPVTSTCYCNSELISLTLSVIAPLALSVSLSV